MSAKQAITALYKASPALAKVIKSEQVTRPIAIKKVWEYIKSNDLQDKTTKTMINNDEAMVSVFGKPTMKQTEIMGGVSKNLVRV